MHLLIAVKTVSLAHLRTTESTVSSISLRLKFEYLIKEYFWKRFI